MAFLLKEHFKKDLRKLFGMNEDELDDVGKEVMAGDAPGEETPAPEGDAPEAASPEADLAADPATDPAADDLAGVEPETPETEQVAGTGDEVQVEAADDATKVSTLFTDIGKPETDYGLTNPNNIRLAKFRFKKAGISPELMMNEVEKKLGLSVEKLIYRLTPEQYESYKEKGKDLRTKFDLIEKREKNIILFNARIPIYYRDKNTNKVDKIDENNPNLLKNAFSKLDEFLIKRFGPHWVDDMNAIDFLQGIKVNFADKESITPNMITTKFFEGDAEKLIPFNKLFVRMPKSIEDFVKENKDNQNYLRSPVYRTVAAGYLEDSTDTAGVFPVIKAEEGAEGAEEQPASPDLGAEGGAEAAGGADLGAEGGAGEAASEDGDADNAALDQAMTDLGFDEAGGGAGGETPPEEPAA